MSATSSVYNFRYENGRRYHAYAEGSKQASHASFSELQLMIDRIPCAER